MIKTHLNICAGIIIILCLAVLLSILFLYQKFPSHSLILNMPYHEARIVILENGWEPYENGNRNYDVIGFHAEDLIRNFGYVEVDDCSGTGMGYCTFYFKNKYNVYLRVTTKETPFPGYDSNIEDFDDMAVFSYGLQSEID